MNIQKLLSEKLLKKINFFSLCLFWAALTFSNALIEISFVAALVSWGLLKIRFKKWPVIELPYSVLMPLIGFLVLSVGSYFWSENPTASFRGIFKILQQVFVFFLAVDFLNEEDNRKRFEPVFIAVFVFTILNALCQYFFGRDLFRGFPGQESHSGLRVSGSFKSYGLLAAFMISTIPVVMAWAYWYWQELRNKKIGFLYGLLSVGGLLILFFTRSRGAWLAFALGVFIFLFLKRKFIFIVLLSLAAAWGVAELPRDTVLHLNAEFKEQSLVERFYLWERAINVVKAKPWGGTGINTYASVHAKYDTTKNWRVRDYYAHNGYLQMAAETGLPSLACFVIFLIQLFRSAVYSQVTGESAKALCLRSGLVVGILNFLLFALVDTILHNPISLMLFWFLLGIFWTYRKQNAGL